MENASKALMMAGGILIAILIIGALFLMFNQISDYQTQNKSNTKSSQLAKFNREFEKYIDDDGIRGTDLISLINKIIDYNKKEETSRVVNYDIKMSITISGFDKFEEKYGYTNSEQNLLKQVSYTIDKDYGKDENTKQLLNILQSYNGIPKSDIAIIKKVYGLYDKKEHDDSYEEIKNELKRIDNDRFKNWKGSIDTDRDKRISLILIANYKEYTEFKSSKFVVDGKPEYRDGQIEKLNFKYKE